MRKWLEVLAVAAFVLIALCGRPADAQQGPSPSLVVTSQVNCTGTAGVLVAAQPSRAHIVTIENTGTTAFYIGPSGVTTSNGFLIPGVANASYSVSMSTTLYCVTGGGTAAVTVIETVGN